MRRQSRRSVQPWLLKRKAAISIPTAYMMEPSPSFQIPNVDFLWLPNYRRTGDNSLAS